MRKLIGMDLQPVLFWMHSEARAIIVCGDRGRASKVIASLVLPTCKEPRSPVAHCFPSAPTATIFFRVFNSFIWLFDIVLKWLTEHWCCSLV
jgi:hypothetical protein